MIRRPPRSTRMTHSFPTRRSSGLVAQFGCGLLLLVPVCAFGGIMVASAGGAIHPPLVTVAAPYVCDGTVEAQSRNYSYKPGQQGVARTIFCQVGRALV